MKIKKEIFGRLDQVCKPGAILASNTSALNVDEIAAATKRPEDVIGCHFFSPANVMRLLENVRGKHSSDRTIATAMKFGNIIKKVPVLVGNCPGFVGNRMLGFYSKSARDVLMQGCLPYEVDGAAEAFGMRMGPLRMSDLVGIDLFGRERARTGAATPATNIDDYLYSQKRFGMKTSAGFYLYDENRKLKRDPAIEAKVVEISAANGVQRRKFEPEEVSSSLFMGLINEGFNILDEGMATRPSDIDVVYVYGYNFPKYRGGPMY